MSYNKTYNLSSSISEFVMIPNRVEMIVVALNSLYMDGTGGWGSCLTVVWYSENTSSDLGCVLIKDC